MTRKWIAMGAAACAVAAGVAIATTAYASTTGTSAQEQVTTAKRAEVAAPAPAEAPASAPAEEERADRTPLSAFLDKDDWMVGDKLWTDEQAEADDAKVQQLLVECLVNKGYDRAAVEQERATGTWTGGNAEQYYADMEGVDSTQSAASEYDPANYGCLGPAQQEVRGAVADGAEALRQQFADLESKMNLLAQGTTGFEAPPEMAAVSADFSACLSKAGFGEYPTPYQLEFAIMNAYVDYDRGAADTAIDTCKTATDYDSRALAARVDMENAFIAANEAELTEYKAAHDAFLTSIGMK